MPQTDSLSKLRCAHSRAAVLACVAGCVVSILLTPTLLAAQTVGSERDDASVSEDAPSGIQVLEGAAAGFEETVDVQLVNVEVWVTDRDGDPVRGLDQSAFTVLEDGRPMEITHFAEVDARPGRAEGQARDVAETRSESVSDARPTTLAPLPAPAATSQRSDLPRTVVVVDDLHLTQNQRKRLLADLRTSIEEETFDLPRFSLVSAGLGLRIEAGFGSTREQIFSALDRIAERPAYGDAMLRERSQLFSSLNDIWEDARSSNFRDPCDDLASYGLRNVETYARVQAQRTASTLAQLGEVTSSLAGVPGPTMVFYAGNGLVTAAGSEYQVFFSEVCPQFQREFQQNSNIDDDIGRFEELARKANAQRVTFTLLDAGGLRASSSSSVEFRDVRFKPSPLFDRAALDNAQNGLFFLADETGGEAIFSRNRFLQPLGDFATEIDHFYSLAYAPPKAGTGEDRNLDVKVEGKKLEVRHRKSYRDKPADERMADRLRSALLLALEDNPLGLEISHRAIAARGEQFSVPIEVTIPLAGLVLIEDAGARTAHLRLQIAARDIEGRTSVFHQKAFRIALGPDVDPAVARHSLVLELAMRGGPHVVAVGLRDQLGRETSYLASRIEVAAGPGSAGSTQSSP